MQSEQDELNSMMHDMYQNKADILINAIGNPQNCRDLHNLIMSTETTIEVKILWYMDIIAATIDYINRKITKEDIDFTVEALRTPPTKMPASWPIHSRKLIRAAGKSRDFVQQALGLATSFQHDLRDKIPVDIFMEVLLEIKIAYMSQQEHQKELELLRLDAEFQEQPQLEEQIENFEQQYGSMFQNLNMDVPALFVHQEEINDESSVIPNSLMSMRRNLTSFNKSRANVLHMQSSHSLLTNVSNTQSKQLQRNDLSMSQLSQTNFQNLNTSYLMQEVSKIKQQLQDQIARNQELEAQLKQIQESFLNNANDNINTNYIFTNSVVFDSQRHIPLNKKILMVESDGPEVYVGEEECKELEIPNSSVVFDGDPQIQFVQQFEQEQFQTQKLISQLAQLIQEAENVQ